MSSPTEIPNRLMSIDEIAEKAASMAVISRYYSDDDIAAGGPGVGWDDFSAEQQVVLLLHCVNAVRRINKVVMLRVSNG